MQMAKKRLVYGVGFNDGKYPASIDGKNLKEYRIWAAMLQRCYSDKFQEQGNHTYNGCYVSENFKSYSYFYDWCQDQIGFGMKDWELDKDLLVKGNNLYSEDMCIFLPRQINTALTKSNRTRGACPIGVSLRSDCKAYIATIVKYGRNVIIGKYKTVDEAFLEYKKQKEYYLAELAEKYKANISESAFQALLNYKVELND